MAQQRHAALCALCCLLLAACASPQVCDASERPSSATAPSPAPPPTFFTYSIVAEHPHDPDAFLQGLQYDLLCPGGNSTPNAGGEGCQEVWWESVGEYGRSSIRLVDVATGKAIRSTPLERKWFGEGLARLGDRVYQLTWQTPTAFVYDVEALRHVATLRSPLADGWGLAATPDGLLVASDGSDRLTWLRPGTLEAVRSVAVKDGDRPIRYLNELEFINGSVWANVWQTECIAQIDPISGAVTGWLLTHGLSGELKARRLRQPRRMDVLNGIAYDVTKDRLFITGKLWPRIFEVRLNKPNQADPRLQQLRQACFI